MGRRGTSGSAVAPDDDLASSPSTGAVTDLSGVFHRLNNQLGIILANAELLEAKLAEESARARASQVVSSALQAMTTAREIRLILKDEQGQETDITG